MDLTDALFCDGGVIGRNPSPLGGTWAWCHVVAGQRTRHASGSVTPAEVGAPEVTNNVSELLAAVLALEAAPDGWAGVLYTDSAVTRFRLLGSHQRAGVPDWLWRRVQAARKRLGGKSRVVLLAGHPTRPDLERGSRADGLPVSPHNCFVDLLCRREARKLTPPAKEVAR